MKIYFFDDNNSQDLNDYFKSLYIATTTKFEERLEIYTKKNDMKYITLITELEDTINDLKNSIFEDFFLKLGTETLEQIRYVSISKHTDKCVVRAVFDILFKYCFDFELKINHLCCNNSEFKWLQMEILHDLRWKIIYTQTIPNQILNQTQNLKI